MGGAPANPQGQRRLQARRLGCVQQSGERAVKVVPGWLRLSLAQALTGSGSHWLFLALYWRLVSLRCRMAGT